MYEVLFFVSHMSFTIISVRFKWSFKWSFKYAFLISTVDGPSVHYYQCSAVGSSPHSSLKVSKNFIFSRFCKFFLIQLPIVNLKFTLPCSEIPLHWNATGKSKWRTYCFYITRKNAEKLFCKANISVSYGYLIEHIFKRVKWSTIVFTL